MDRDWEKLRKWIIKKRLEGRSVTGICSEAQIDRKMFYRWWNRYQTQGWNGLAEKPKGRPSLPEPDSILKEKGIKLRKRYEWGPKKIAGCLKRKGYEIDNNQAYQIICEAGLNHPITMPRKTWGTKRFQREHCNSLWQADFKLCNDDFWMISYLDDRSRFITGSVKIWSPTGDNAMLLLIELLSAMVRQSRFSQIRELSLNRRVEKYLLLIFTVVNLELIISLLAFVGLQPVVKLKHFIKRTKWSLIYSRSIGASYATITTQDHTKE